MRLLRLKITLVLIGFESLLTTPKEKVSQVSDTGRLWITSGAIHGNVPTRDMCVVCVRNFDAPKSQICGISNRIESNDYCQTHNTQKVPIICHEGLLKLLSVSVITLARLSVGSAHAQ